LLDPGQRAVAAVRCEVLSHLAELELSLHGRHPHQLAALAGTTADVGCPWP